MKYHLTSATMAIIKRTTIEYWQECGEIGALVQCWWKCNLVQPLQKLVWRIPKNVKIELSYDPVIPVLGIHPKKIKTLI